MIVLRILRRPDGAPPGPDLHPINPAGSTIGRAPDCDILLDDPLRLVSRRHAWIVPEGNGLALVRCISTVAPLGVNDEPLSTNDERLVRSGDRLRIGAYEAEIEIRVLPAPLPAVDPMAATVFAPRTEPAAPPLPPPTPPARPPRLDRWFNLDTVPDPLGPGSPLPSLDGGAALPERAWSATRQPPRADPGERSAFAPAPGPALAPTPAPPEVPWPRTVAPAAALPPAAGGPQAPAPGPDTPAMQQAFLRGAGLDPATPMTLDEEQLAHLGALLRAAVDGTMGLLHSRAVTKRNLRAKGTRITARQNNLLKFAPDAGEALKQLLNPRERPGFLAPVDAMHEAHKDLQVHQLAMVAGMRAAMLDLINRLGPAAIEAEADPPQGLARMLPAQHDALLWRRLRHMHARLLENLDDTFETVFGREFLRAYEAHSAPSPGDEPGPLQQDP
jgi:type VI secretion system FHA domain protein